MKIVHIIPSLEKGGAERFVVELTSELSRNKNDQVFVVSLFDNGENTFLNELSSAVTYCSLGKNRGLDFSIFFKIKKTLRKIKPDIVHTHLGAFEYTYFCKFLFKKGKYFHTIHNLANAECTSDFIKVVRSFLFKNRYVVPVTISKTCSVSFFDYYHQKSDVLIENGRSLPKITPDKERIKDSYITGNASEYLFVNIARISAQKNQTLLIDAINKVNNKSDSKCKLLIIGDVQDEQIFKKLIPKITDDSITILKAQKNIADYLYIADAFCLSSSFEGMPISVIEALAMGCIPICTPVGGITDMIEDGKDGFLSTDLTTDAYAEAIERFIKSSEKEQMSLNGKKKFDDRFDITKTAQKHRESYCYNLGLKN